MNDYNLGRLLRIYRKSNNYTVNDVIEHLKNEYHISISPKTLYSWENSQNQPSADTFLVLCKIYNITNILESLGYKSSTEQPPLILTPEEKELIIKYRSNNFYHPAIRKLLDMKE